MPPPTLTDRFRRLFDGLLTPVGAFLHRSGVHPDAVTIIGLLIVLIGCGMIASGRLQLGGLILLLALPCDALDGAVARAANRDDSFGAVLDSSLDRYADGFIFAALSYHFAVVNQFALLAATLTALVGSYMVSYVRARAEGVQVDVKIGLFTRLERLLLLLVILLVPVQTVREVGLWLLAIGTNLTALQRLWFVYKTLKERE